MPVEGSIETCPDGVELEALLAGQLPTADMARLLRHVTNCEHCLPLLRTAGVPTDRAAATPRIPGSDTVKGEGRCGPRPRRARIPKFARASVTGTPTCDGPPPSWRGLLAPAQSNDELGRLGSYRILRVLGEGGMGIVFEAEDTTLGRHVAIKVLRSAEIDQPQRKRFLQEAQIVASLSSDHIVTIYQVGEEAGCMYIVMELLRGETLDTRLRSEGSLSLVEALRSRPRSGRGALGGPRKAARPSRHQTGQCMAREARDADESARRIKLLDFGVARPLAVHEHLTFGGQIIGTPAYMSPEQACGMPVDQRSDLFSLGSIMYAMLTGKSPFERASYLHILKAVVEEPAAPLAEVMPGVPVEIVRLVERLLEKDAKSRPASARQVADQIRQMEQSFTNTGMIPPEFPTSGTTRAVRFRRRIGWGVWAGILVIAAAALLGGWSQYHRVVRFRHKGDAEEAPVVPLVSAAVIPTLPAAASGSARPRSAADDDDNAAAAPAADLPTIKVGIIHSLTGPMATSERTIVDAFLMAVDEINEAGGLLGGRQIEAIVRDGKSNEFIFAEQAEDLITNEQVVTLFGCWRSPCRKLVEEVCRRHDHLLVYPTTYEGLEESPYVIYMGGSAESTDSTGREMGLRLSGQTKVLLDRRRWHLFAPLTKSFVTNWQRWAARWSARAIVRWVTPISARSPRRSPTRGADVVINTVSGTGNISLFNCLREAGVTADNGPHVVVQGDRGRVAIRSRRHDRRSGRRLLGVELFSDRLPNQENHDFLERLPCALRPNSRLNRSRWLPPMPACTCGPAPSIDANRITWPTFARPCSTKRFERARRRP